MNNLLFFSFFYFLHLIFKKNFQVIFQFFLLPNIYFCILKQIHKKYHFILLSLLHTLLYYTKINYNLFLDNLINVTNKIYFLKFYFNLDIIILIIILIIIHFFLLLIHQTFDLRKIFEEILFLFHSYNVLIHVLPFFCYIIQFFFF